MQQNRETLECPSYWQVPLSLRQVHWPRILAEGTAIVVSILLAFAIQAWWEGRQERAVEAEILAGLTSDFRSNHDQLALVVAMLEQLLPRLAELNELDEGQLAQVPDDLLPQYVSALQATPTFDARDATLDAAISSGNLRSIQDSQLRSLLAEWRGAVEDVAEEATDFRIASASAIDRVSVLGGPWIGVDPSDHILATGPASVEALSRFAPPDLGAVAADDVLLSRLRVKRIRALAYLRFLTPVVALTDSVLVELES